MKTILLLSSLLFLSACSSTTERNIQQKVGQESTIQDGPSLGINVRAAIKESRTLTNEQKKELEEVLAKVGKENQLLSEKSYKLRGILIKDLIQPQMNTKEVWQLKKDIRKTESKRVKNTLQAMSEISSILGNDPSAKWYMENSFNR